MVWADAEEKVAIARADRDEPTTTPTERDANARLIATAPELLAALEDAAKLIPDPDYLAIIRKAKGEV